MVSVGLGYLVNHLVPTQFWVDIAILLSYCVVLDHSVAGSIMVTSFKVKFCFFPVLLITQVSIISIHSLFYGVSSDSLAGNLTYFIFDCFVCCQVSPLVTSFCMEFLIPYQYKCCRIFASAIPISS